MCDSTEMDMTKASAVFFNNRNSSFVKRMMIKIMEEYAQSTDNTIDDALVKIIKERLNVDNYAMAHFAGYDSY